MLLKKICSWVTKYLTLLALRRETFYGAKAAALCLACYCASVQGEVDFVSTGGQFVNHQLCPKQYNDVIVPMTQLAPSERDGEPEMTISGLHSFMEREGISTLAQLLARLPIYYRTNFSLMEITRATGQANLQFPRIILFGPDGHFLANVGTKADDPNYQKLDVAQMHRATGEWEFSVFDFSGETPRLERRVESCARCHGQQNPRPVWGDHLLWDGAFGDNKAPGPNGEALDADHAERMTLIRSGQGGSERFSALVWADEPLPRGGKRHLAHHAFGVDLLMSNIAMGSASARSVYLQIQHKHPELASDVKELMLLLGYMRYGHLVLTPTEKLTLRAALERQGFEANTLDELLLALGIDVQQAFSLATLADSEVPNPNWSAGAGNLYDMLLLQMLSDVIDANSQVKALLKNISGQGVLDCPGAANNLYELTAFKMLYLFHLQGRSRYEVYKVFYPLDLEDIYSRVFLPAAHVMTQYLRQRWLAPGSWEITANSSAIEF